MNPRNHHPAPPMTEEERQAAATLTPFVEATRRNIDRAIDQVGLRKWCVEQAVGFFPHYVVTNNADRFGDLDALFRQIYAWVHAPIDQTITELEDKTKGR